MKFLETSFVDYIESVNHYNLHKKNETLLKNLPQTIEELDNHIIYGPKGVGKYSQSLLMINKYSNSGMKHEKKINILFNKKYNHNFKISDIHYEVDMGLLGCNSRTLWQEIYNHIIDIISSKQSKTGIILCKNFHNIDWELSDIFYNYMNINYKVINVKFILLCENMSFLDSRIINKCNVISLARPTKTAYNKILSYKIPTSIKSHEISNIKALKSSVTQLTNPHYSICNRIIEQILDYKNISILELRDNLYDLLTYDLNIEECMWYIIHSLQDNKYIKETQVINVFNELNKFLRLYINNYRPIFHLERYILYLCKVINEL